MHEVHELGCEPPPLRYGGIGCGTGAAETARRHCTRGHHKRRRPRPAHLATRPVSLAGAPGDRTRSAALRPCRAPSRAQRCRPCRPRTRTPASPRRAGDARCSGGLGPPHPRAAGGDCRACAVVAADRAHDGAFPGTRSDVPDAPRGRGGIRCSKWGSRSRYHPAPRGPAGDAFVPAHGGEPLRRTTGRASARDEAERGNGRTRRRDLPALRGHRILAWAVRRTLPELGVRSAGGPCRL